MGLTGVVWMGTAHRFLGLGLACVFFCVCVARQQCSVSSLLFNIHLSFFLLALVALFYSGELHALVLWLLLLFAAASLYALVLWLLLLFAVASLCVLCFIWSYRGQYVFFWSGYCGRFGVTCLFRLGRCGHASLVGGVVRMRETVGASLWSVVLSRCSRFPCSWLFVNKRV